VRREEESHRLYGGDRNSHLYLDHHGESYCLLEREKEEKGKKPSPLMRRVLKERGKFASSRRKKEKEVLDLYCSRLGKKGRRERRVERRRGKRGVGLIVPPKAHESLYSTNGQGRGGGEEGGREIFFPHGLAKRKKKRSTAMV